MYSLGRCGRRAAACFLLLAVICGTATAVSVSLLPANQTVITGGVCTVDVWIEGLVAPGLEALDLTLTYDPTLLDAIGVAAGPLMTDLGEPMFEWLDLSTDGFIYAAATLGPLSSTGSGVALSITFQASSVNVGTSPLNYDIVLVEPSEPYGTGLEIPHTESTGDSVTVSIVPEPASLGVLAAGLLALVVRRSRRRRRGRA